MNEHISKLLEQNETLLKQLEKKIAQRTERLKAKIGIIRKLKREKQNLVETAHACVAYVGRANYPERQLLAEKAIEVSSRSGKYVDPYNLIGEDKE